MLDRTIVRDVLDRWYEGHPYPLTQHHVQSYDQFIGDRLQVSMVTMNNGFTMIKRHSDGRLYEARVSVGGKSGQGWSLDRPTLPDGRLMYPNDARLTNASYASLLYVDILIEYFKDGQLIASKTFPQVKLGAIPIMLHSSICVLQGQAPSVLYSMGECPFDEGGYFIIGGKEKVLVAQERIAYNRLFVTKTNEKSTDHKIFSHDAFIRSMPPDDLFPRLLRMRVFAPGHKRQNAIVCMLPHVQGDIPIFAMFRALGIESDLEIISFIVGQVDSNEDSTRQQLTDFLRDSIVDCGRQNIWTQAKAIDVLAHRAGKLSLKQVKNLLVNNVLPNAGSTFDDKAAYLGHLVLSLIRVCLGVRPPTDRDSWVHKRMDLSGFLIADLFRDTYRRFRMEAMSRLDQEFLTGPWRQSGEFERMVTVNNLKRIFDASVIERGMIRSFKGQWNVDEKNMDVAYKREGVVQDLNRQSYQTYMSHVRRVSTVMSAELKLVSPHLLYAAQWGAVCPVDSPDGANVGLMKHFSVMCHLTCDRNPDSLSQHLLSIGLVRDLAGSKGRMTRIFVNHGLLGVTEQPPDLVRYVRLLRRTGLAAPDISVTWDIFGWEINILTDGGRTCRPLVCIVDQGLSRLSTMAKTSSWARLICGTLLTDAELPKEFSGGDACAKPEILVQHGARDMADLPAAIKRLAADAAPIELIDTEELSTILVTNSRQTTPRATHVEIHPAAMFSHLTASIPLLDHNPAAYNSLCIAQTKQGLGLYSSAFMHRMDVSGMVLHSSQLPLVTTYFADKLCRGQLTHGENLVVAIATYGGFNQEDALIVNKTSVERGLLNVSVFATASFQEESSWDGATRILVANPMQLTAKAGIPVEDSRDPNVTGLSATGTPLLETRITEGSPLIGMCRVETPQDQQSQPRVTDMTQRADKTIWGTVDRVYLSQDAPGSRTCKVRLREVRAPDLGDKLASRYGQKGVVGMLLEQTDMPFSQDGTVPDVIINPNGFPKRMTVGHLLEAILGRAACDMGSRMDGTSFEGKDPVASAKEYFMSRPPGERWTTTGDMVLYNGKTGHQMETQVFVGVNYYNRLKHMAVDKINYRSTGPRNFLTHQPTQGRGAAGGLKIGEMEQHCILTHGLSSFLKESYSERSDGFAVKVDERSGHIHHKGTQLPAGVSATVTAAMPYSFKQFTHELEAMAISMQFDV